MFAHFEALEADFQREYGLDLRECLWGAVPSGARRLLSLITGLSPRSAFTRNVSANGKDWGTSEELLASLIEQVDLNNRLFFSANTKKGVHAWKPMQIPRPTAPKRKPSTINEVRRFFGSGIGKVVTA